MPDRYYIESGHDITDEGKPLRDADLVARLNEQDDDLTALRAQLEETQRVREAVLSIFGDPRYREAWSDGEILTRLLSALDPWWREAHDNA